MKKKAFKEKYYPVVEIKVEKKPKKKEVK